MPRLLRIVLVLVCLTAAAAPAPAGGGGSLERKVALMAGPGSRAAAATAGLAGTFVCPVKGPVTYSSDFGAHRGHGRRHVGNDLFSPRGTENVAVVPGTLEAPPRSGTSVVAFLWGDDGNRYVYMHLLRVVGPVPRHVEAGEVIALTGSAGGGQGSHTHFEFHPGGGPPADAHPLIASHC